MSVVTYKMLGSIVMEINKQKNTIISTVIVMELLTFENKELVPGLESQHSYTGCSPLFCPDFPATYDLGRCAVYRRWEVNRKHCYDDAASMISPMVR